MDYKRCRGCKFWVTVRDRQCPDCGISLPHRRRVGQELGLFISPFAVLLFSLMVGAIQGSAEAFMGVLPLALCLGVVLYYAFAAMVTMMAGTRKPTTQFLQRHEQTIKDRLEEIDNSLDRMQVVRERVDGGLNGGEREGVLAALDAAGSIHMQHRDQYRLKLFDIELARWMNRVEPLASNLDELSYEGCEHCLKALGKATRRGRKLLHDWDESGLEEAQGGGASGARLRSALAACDELRKGVIARQARTVVATVRPLGDEALPDSPCAALDSRFEVFNARAELGQFTASLRELEAEHARLQARAEVTAHVPGVLS